MAERVSPVKPRPARPSSQRVHPRFSEAYAGSLSFLSVSLPSWRMKVFGGYIHTYKFSEGVEDGVVLDLVYEARDIVKNRWGTMQNVLSSKSRMDRVMSDIVFDFSVKPRLSSERGNAILVASSIYEACKYFTLFQKTPFRGKCAVVTSLQSADQGRDAGGNRRQHRNRQAVHLQYLHQPSEGHRRRAGP